MAVAPVASVASVFLSLDVCQSDSASARMWIGGVGTRWCIHVGLSPALAEIVCTAKRSGDQTMKTHHRLTAIAHRTLWPLCDVECVLSYNNKCAYNGCGPADAGTTGERRDASMTQSLCLATTLARGRWRQLKRKVIEQRTNQQSRRAISQR